MKGSNTQKAWQIALASVTAQVGCLTIILILLALLTGRWLDGQFGTRPWFTIGLLLASVPVTLLLMIRLALRGTRSLTTGPACSSTAEESTSDNRDSS